MTSPSPIAAQVRGSLGPVVRGALAPLAKGVLDAILPPRCLACGCATDATGTLCADCWMRVRFLSEPLCAGCGVPFDFEVDDGALCGACVATRRSFARARAAIAYDDGSRGFILAFKNGDRTDAVRTLAPWMARAGRDLIADADLLVPVPLHWTRLFVRKYNQAALLAYAVARLAGNIPVEPTLLVRSRRTRALKRAGAEKRAATVSGAFAVPERRRARLAGRRVLLIDDVYTTGSTVGACARTLLRAGAASVDVLTLARVVRPAVPAGVRPPSDPSPIPEQENPS